MFYKRSCNSENLRFQPSESRTRAWRVRCHWIEGCLALLWSRRHFSIVVASQQTSFCAERFADWCCDRTWRWSVHLCGSRQQSRIGRYHSESPVWVPQIITDFYLRFVMLMMKNMNCHFWNAWLFIFQLSTTWIHRELTWGFTDF